VNNKNESRLKEFLEKPEKALWSIALPVMAGMAIQTMYSIVDMLFIGQLGGESITAVAFNMPLYFFVMGITFGIGTGLTSSISRAIGSENKERANSAAEHGIILGLILGLTLTIAGLILGKDVLSMLGAPKEMLDESWGYLRVTCYGMTFVVFAIVFRSILAGEGDMKFPVMVAVIGTVLNIILDPIFIFNLERYGGFGLGMGVEGAAAASVVSQMIVFSIFIYMLFWKDHAYITFNLREFQFSPELMKEILWVGIPSSVSMLIMSFGQGVFNYILIIGYGAEAVAAYTISGRLDMLMFLPIMGIATGLVTTVGMFTGAKRMDKVRHIIIYGITRAFGIVAIASLSVFLLAPKIMGLFTDDPMIEEIGIGALRTLCFAYPFVGIAMPCGRIMQGLGQGFPVLVITALRVLLISAPLAYYFAIVQEMEIIWVWYSIAISIGVSAIVGPLWVWRTINTMENNTQVISE
tara:strand:- start:1530 stop:2927 length:1398 start_codon:yes stop_codon:yes gene_type:complete